MYKYQVCLFCFLKCFFLLQLSQQKKKTMNAVPNLTKCCLCFNRRQNETDTRHTCNMMGLVTISIPKKTDPNEKTFQQDTFQQWQKQFWSTGANTLDDFFNITTAPISRPKVVPSSNFFWQIHTFRVTHFQRPRTVFKSNSANSLGVYLVRKAHRRCDHRRDLVTTETSIQCTRDCSFFAVWVPKDEAREQESSSTFPKLSLFAITAVFLASVAEKNTHPLDAEWSHNQQQSSTKQQLHLHW